MDSVIRFSVFEADVHARELRKQGLKIKLADQPFSILAMLLDRPGQVVTRQELQKQLWAADTFVDFDRGLNKAVNRLREALGDSAEAPRFIETLPKRGYRFIGHLEPPLPVIPEPVVVVIPQQTPPAPRPERAGWTYLAWTAVLLFLVGAAAFVSFGRSPFVEPLVRSSLLPPPHTSFLPYNFALSPDGTHLAFVAEAASRQMLWVRSLSAAGAEPLGGTEGASFPFWAPDSRRIGFFADRQLRAVDIAGGAVRILSDAPRPSGGAWSGDGVIVYAPDVNGPLYRVPATVGTPTPVTRISEAQESNRWPFFLPDGRHFLYVTQGRSWSQQATGIFVGSVESVDSPASTRISAARVRNAIFALNHVFFVRGGTLAAQPFAPVRLEGNGPTITVAEREVAVASTFFPSGFSISNNGLLAFQSSTDLASRLTWIDAAGTERESLPEGTYADPSVSPDGRFVAVSCDERGNGVLAICVHDLARHVAARVTAGTNDRYPVWSPDGRQIAYLASDGIYRMPADGSGTPQPVSSRGIPSSWSADDQILSYGSDSGTLSLWVSSVTDRRAVELGPGSEGQFSPDGNWIVHNGVDGIVVRRFPGPGGRVQIASYEAAQPRWSRNGRQIVYVARDKKLMAVDFDPVTGTAGASHVLFQTRIVAAAFIGHQYDVAPDGRFLVNSLTSPAPPLTLLTGWSAALPR